MSRDPANLLDILISARLIREYIQGADREAFITDRALQDAVMRRMVIIGEATRRISPEFRSEHPEIPWRGMTGIRSKLIHDYDKINLDTVWNVIQNDIPALIEQIAPLVPPDEDDDRDS
jgi:uncharacterized protein with HEPN domain